MHIRKGIQLLRGHDASGYSMALGWSCSLYPTHSGINPWNSKCTLGSRNVLIPGLRVSWKSGAIEAECDDVLYLPAGLLAVPLSAVILGS